MAKAIDEEEDGEGESKPQQPTEASPTFAQMQMQGQARPAPTDYHPSIPTNTNPIGLPQPNVTGGGQQANSQASDDEEEKKKSQSSAPLPPGAPPPNINAQQLSQPLGITPQQAQQPHINPIPNNTQQFSAPQAPIDLNEEHNREYWAGQSKAPPGWLEQQEAEWTQRMGDPVQGKLIAAQLAAANFKDTGGLQSFDNSQTSARNERIQGMLNDSQTDPTIRGLIQQPGYGTAMQGYQMQTGQAPNPWAQFTANGPTPQAQPTGPARYLQGGVEQYGNGQAVQGGYNAQSDAANQLTQQGYSGMNVNPNGGWMGQPQPGAKSMASALAGPLGGNSGVNNPATGQPYPGANGSPGGSANQNLSPANIPTLGGGGGSNPYANQTISSHLLDQVNNGSSYNNPLTGQMQSLLSQYLNKPSAYDADMVKQTRDRMMGDLDEQYRQQGVKLNEEMAGRGLSQSSIYGGRLNDLYSNQARDRTSLVQSLLEDQAKQYGTDRAQSLGAASQFGSQGLNEFQTNEGARLGRLNQAMGYDQDVAGRSFQAQNINNQQQQQQLEMWKALMGL